MIFPRSAVPGKRFTPTPTNGIPSAPWFEPPAVPQGAEKRDPEEPDDHASGRSRGGFSSKIHLVCDAGECPLPFELSAGQAHETTSLVEWWNGIDDELKTGAGDLVPWLRAIRAIEPTGSTKCSWKWESTR